MPQKDPRLVLKAMCQVAWPIIRLHYNANCCIAASRIGLDVLKSFGIAARPQVVSALAGSPAFHAWDKAEAPPANAFFVTISISRSEPGSRAFGGHLVLYGKVRGEYFLLDLSAPQLHRPQKNILVPEPVLLFSSEPIDKRHCVSVISESGTVLYYEPEEPLDDWQGTPDWTMQGHEHEFDSLKATLAEAVRRLLDRSTD